MIALPIPTISQLPHVWSSQTLSQHSNYQQHRTTLRTTCSSSSRYSAGSLWTRLNLIPLCQLLYQISVNCNCNCKTVRKRTWLVHGIPILNGQCVKFVFCQDRMMKSWHVSTPWSMLTAFPLPPRETKRKDRRKRFGYGRRVRRNNWLKWLRKVKVSIMEWTNRQEHGS